MTPRSSDPQQLTLRFWLDRAYLTAIRPLSSAFPQNWSVWMKLVKRCASPCWSSTPRCVWA